MDLSAPAPEPEQDQSPESPPTQAPVTQIPVRQPEAQPAQITEQPTAPVQPEQYVPAQPQVYVQPVQTPQPTPTPAQSIYPAAEQAPTYTQPSQPTMHAHDPGNGFGIASIVTSFLGLSIVGIILGLVAIKKSKGAGRQTNILGLIGVIFGAVVLLLFVPLVLLVLNNFQGAQAKTRDTQSVTRLTTVHSKLEEYYNINSAYPKELSPANLVGIDPSTLTDNLGNPITMADGSALNISEALEYDLPTRSNQYQYIPFDCGDTYCMGYVIRIYIERPNATTQNPYTKTGLQNP